MTIKLFNRWDSNVEVLDRGLKDCVTLRPLLVPKTGAKYARTRFWKSKYHIVERLINKLMVPGHKGKKHLISSGLCGGKSLTGYTIVVDAFKRIEQVVKQNPVAVFVKAIENAAPREEITTIEYGGARYPQSVDCAPLRRVDLALRFFVQGAYQRSFGKKTKMNEALSEEIIKAYQNDIKCFAIQKKNELEKQAEAAR